MLDRPNSKAAWLARAAALKPEGRAFIDGAYVTAASGETFARISPIDGRVFAEIAERRRRRHRPRRRRRAAQLRGRRLARRRRRSTKKKVLLRFAELIREHTDEIALLETLDVGKPIANALAVDVPFCANCIQYYAEFADKLYDEIAPAAGPDELALVRKEPLGVVGAIVPWNYPLIIAAWKIGPALLAGNSVVLKPAEQSSLGALLLARLAREAGLPDGVLNVVPGFGEKAGKALALHNDVDMISFTGSTEVGKLMMVYAGQSNMKRVALECGGKIAACRDARRRSRARRPRRSPGASTTTRARPATPARRVLAHESIRAELVAAIAEVQRTQIPLGHPFEAASQLGALIEQSHMERVLGYIEIGVKEGAQVALGGKRGAAGDRRLLCRADDPRRGAQRHAHRAGGDLRPGRRRDPVRGRGGGDPPRQRHDLRPRRGGVDQRHARRASHVARDPGGHGLGQHLRPLLDDDAVRRLQADRASAATARPTRSTNIWT